jgi:hypothetical protein
MTCPYCGTEMPTSALFCGECGRLLTERRAATTSVQSPPPPPPPIDVAAAPVPSASASAQDATEAVALPEIAAGNDAEPVVEPPVDQHPGGELLAAPVASGARVDEEQVDEEQGDGEQTVLGSAHGSAHRFSLQFSTGESVAVFGTGLVGRNPRPEPREYFDHIVTISDPGKSVSKTHLEFGNEDGEFWVSDRVSGNGTSVLVPGTPIRRCEPTKRYFVARGGKVVIGDQFFTVS